MHGAEVLKKFRYRAKAILRRTLKPFLIRMTPIEETLNIFGVSFAGNEHHLVQTLAYIDSNPSWRLKDTPTYQYHMAFKPKTFFDFSSIAGTERLPVFLYPWGTFSSGSTSNEKSANDSRFLGPSSIELVESEVQLVVSLLNSVRTNGFNPYVYPNTDINGTLMVSSDREQKACVIMQGNHRVAVLSYLGFEKVPVRLGRVCLRQIDQAQVNKWPLVNSGLVTRETASAAFDFFFQKTGR